MDSPSNLKCMVKLILGYGPEWLERTEPFPDGMIYMVTVQKGRGAADKLRLPVLLRQQGGLGRGSCRERRWSSSRERIGGFEYHSLYPDQEGCFRTNPRLNDKVDPKGRLRAYVGNTVVFTLDGAGERGNAVRNGLRRLQDRLYAWLPGYACGAPWGRDLPHDAPRPDERAARAD